MVKTERPRAGRVSLLHCAQSLCGQGRCRQGHISASGSEKERKQRARSFLIEYGPDVSMSLLHIPLTQAEPQALGSHKGDQKTESPGGQPGGLKLDEWPVKEKDTAG